MQLVLRHRSTTTPTIGTLVNLDYSSDGIEDLEDHFSLLLELETYRYHLTTSQDIELPTSTLEMVTLTLDSMKTGEMRLVPNSTLTNTSKDPLFSNSRSNQLEEKYSKKRPLMQHQLSTSPLHSLHL